jgi:hypothetical protein
VSLIIRIINILISETAMKNRNVKPTSWISLNTSRVNDAEEELYIRVTECASMLLQ